MHDLDSIIAGTAQLVPLPQAYVRVRALVNDPHASAGAIAAVIATEPVLTARLLHIANSAWFGRAGRIATVREAVALLGIDEVHDLALAVSAVASLSRLARDRAALAAFWRLSVHCAIIARDLGMRQGTARGERLFVAGLLHAVGAQVLAHALPAEDAAAREEAGRRAVPVWLVQRERLGFDYAAIGAALLARWEFPRALCAAVRWHPSPAEAREATLEASLVHVAAALARAAATRADEPDGETAPEPVAVQIAGVEPDEIEELLARADGELLDALALLLPDGASRGGPPARFD